MYYNIDEIHYLLKYVRIYYQIYTLYFTSFSFIKTRFNRIKEINSIFNSNLV